jgi:hypothetical protein
MALPLSSALLTQFFCDDSVMLGVGVVGGMILRRASIESETAGTRA